MCRFMGFNEAGAKKPRKVCYVPTCATQTRPSFNEAGAKKPRKVSRRRTPSCLDMGLQ